MATVNKIYKVLAGVQDLLFGQGTVTQSRVGVDEVINKINGDVIPYSGDAATANLVPINAQIDNVEAGAAPRGNISIPVVSGIVTLTVPQWYNASFDITGALTGNVELVLPDNLPQIFVVDNLTTGSFTLTVKHAATPGISIARGVRSLLYTSGVVVESITTAVADVVTKTSATGSAELPGGLSAQRDTPASGKYFFRFNTTLFQWEQSANGAAWTKVVVFTSATGSILVPSGTTAERDAAPVNGMLRYNTTLGIFEGYEGGAWRLLGSGSGGGGGGDIGGASMSGNDVVMSANQWQMIDLDTLLPELPSQSITWNGAGLFQIVTTGNYLINAQIDKAHAGVDSKITVGISTGLPQASVIPQRFSGVNDANNNVVAGTFGPIYLVAGDYVRLYVNSSITDALLRSATTRMTIHKV